MKKLMVFLVAIGMLFLSAGAGLGEHHEIKIQEKDGIGKYLSDTEGRTLYWFKNDSPGKSACSGGCVAMWPLYYRETVAAPMGIEGSDFGTITRDYGTKQTTFRGYPLYYFVNDKQAGDTSGQGANSVWYVVNPDNFPPK